LPQNRCKQGSQRNGKCEWKPVHFLSQEYLGRPFQTDALAEIRERSASRSVDASQKPIEGETPSPPIKAQPVEDPADKMKAMPDSGGIKPVDKGEY